MGLTIEKAYKLAVKKWEIIIENNGRDMDDDEFPSPINTLFCACAYCDKFALKTSTPCENCPLNIFKVVSNDFWSSNGCHADKHPFHKWSNMHTVKKAQAVLDLIIKTKPF